MALALARYQLDSVVLDINVQVISHTTTKTEFNISSAGRKITDSAFWKLCFIEELRQTYLHT